MAHCAKLVRSPSSIANNMHSPQLISKNVDFLLNKLLFFSMFGINKEVAFLKGNDRREKDVNGR